MSSAALDGRRVTGLVLAAILLAGVGWRLTTIAATAYDYDTAWALLLANANARGFEHVLLGAPVAEWEREVARLHPGVAGRPLGSLLLTALALGFGTPIWGPRALAVAGAALTILFAFLLARRVGLGRAASLAAALGVAGSTVHVEYTWAGHQVVTAGAFLTAACWLFVRAEQAARPRGLLVLAGLVFGLGVAVHYSITIVGGIFAAVALAAPGARRPRIVWPLCGAALAVVLVEGPWHARGLVWQAVYAQPVETSFVRGFVGQFETAARFSEAFGFGSIGAREPLLYVRDLAYREHLALPLLLALGAAAALGARYGAVRPLAAAVIGTLAVISIPHMRETRTLVPFLGLLYVVAAVPLDWLVRRAPAGLARAGVAAVACALAVTHAHHAVTRPAPPRVDGDVALVAAHLRARPGGAAGTRRALVHRASQVQVVTPGWVLYDWIDSDAPAVLASGRLDLVAVSAERQHGLDWFARTGMVSHDGHRVHRGLLAAPLPPEAVLGPTRIHRADLARHATARARAAEKG